MIREGWISNFACYNVWMIIVGIDPGIGRMGWGVIKDQKGQQTMLDCGCFETEGKVSDEARLLKIHNFVKELLEAFRPDMVVVEALFFTTNAKTAFSVGQARGVILLTIAQAGISVISYTPLQVKLSISGYGKADKSQIQQMVKSLLKLEKVPRPDDAADALAVAMTYANSYKLSSKTL